MNQNLFTAVDSYIDDLYIPHDEALEAALQKAQEMGQRRIVISPNQGKFLHILALLCRARRILEIGTFVGYSAIWLARALPPDGRLITLEREEHHAEIARSILAQAGLSNMVEVRVGDALESMSHLEVEHSASFDMVFIDAEKEPYPDFLQSSLRLVRPGGLIVADNAIRHGQVIDHNNTDSGIEGIRHYNAELASNPRCTATIVQTVGVKGYDGMSIAIVR